VDDFSIHLEYMRNGINFQCHPNYKSNGEWYNWVQVRFDTSAQKVSRRMKGSGMWSANYFPSKIMCFFVIPQDNTIYAIIHLTCTSDHKKDSILFKRWELENSTSIQRNEQRNVSPNLHVVDVDTFSDPILTVEDYTTTELQFNTERAMVTVVLLFAKAWPNKFMSSYHR